MKKIFTILAASAICLASSAVELNVTTNSGTVLPDGNVLFNTPDPESLTEDGVVAIFGKLEISASEAVDAEVSVTLSEGVEKYGFCFQQCMPLEVGQTIKQNVSITPDKALSVMVEPMLISEPWTPDLVRTYVFDLKITSGSETLKTFSIIVTNDENASIKAVGADKDAFTVAGRYIYWNLPSAPGVMTVYSLDGRVVEQMRLSTASGSKALILPAGVYIWATPTHSGKILIRN